MLWSVRDGGIPRDPAAVGSIEHPSSDGPTKGVGMGCLGQRCTLIFYPCHLLCCVTLQFLSLKKPSLSATPVLTHVTCYCQKDVNQ